MADLTIGGGERVLLRAQAQHTVDGTVLKYVPWATWVTSNSNIISLSTGGPAQEVYATGVGLGGATVTAIVAGATALYTILVETPTMGIESDRKR